MNDLRELRKEYSRKLKKLVEGDPDKFVQGLSVLYNDQNYSQMSHLDKEDLLLEAFGIKVPSREVQAGSAKGVAEEKEGCACV